ncbi:uncharacterized protein LOC144119631 [Amblyomma americanum]
MSSDGANEGDKAGAVSGTHRCRVRETKKVGVEPVLGLRASSLNAVDVNQASRSLASWRRHLVPTKPSEAGQRRGSRRPAQQPPKPVAAPDPSVAGTESIMNVLKRVSEIQVTVEYIDSPLSSIIERIKPCTPEASDDEAERSGAGSDSAPCDSATTAARQ